jgi:hypothetical protein
MADPELVKEMGARLKKMLKGGSVASRLREIEDILDNLETQVRPPAQFYNLSGHELNALCSNPRPPPALCLLALWIVNRPRIPDAATTPYPHHQVRKPSIELLTTTKVGVPVKKLSTPNRVEGLTEELRSRAAALVARWQQRVAKLESRGKGSPPTTPRGGTPSAAPSTTTSSTPSTSKPKPSSSGSVTTRPQAAKVAAAPSTKSGGGGGGGGLLPQPGSTSDEKLTFFSSRFQFWNRDISTDTVRVKRRTVIFQKFAAHRAAVAATLAEEGGAESRTNGSDTTTTTTAAAVAASTDLYLTILDMAERVESAVNASCGKRPAVLKTKLTDLVHALGTNVNLVKSLFMKVRLILLFRLCSCSCSGSRRVRSSALGTSAFAYAFAGGGGGRGGGE